MEKYRDEIENYVNCSHLARRDRDFGSIILMFRDEIEITYCYSHVSRRERETQIEFLKVEREKSQSILTRPREHENSCWSLTRAIVFRQRCLKISIGRPGLEAGGVGDNLCFLWETMWSDRCDARVKMYPERSTYQVISSYLLTSLTAGFWPNFSQVSLQNVTQS